MILLSLLFSPEEYMLPGLNKKLFGIDCFGCGLQRSAVLLFQGEFILAFKMYPAIYTLIPLFTIFILNSFFKLKYGTKIISILAVLSILLIIINYILKLTN